MSQGLVKPAQELGLEAGGKGRARLVQYLANAAQAQSMHEALGCLAKAERGEWQGMQNAHLLTGGNDGAILLAVMSNGPSGPCRVGNRQAHDEPKALEASGKIGQQPFFPAEKMGAALDSPSAPLASSQGATLGV
jgi:hypothetical protein